MSNLNDVLQRFWKKGLVVSILVLMDVELKQTHTEAPVRYASGFQSLF